MIDDLPASLTPQTPPEEQIPQPLPWIRVLMLRIGHLATLWAPAARRRIEAELRRHEHEQRRQLAYNETQSRIEEQARILERLITWSYAQMGYKAQGYDPDDRRRKITRRVQIERIGIDLQRVYLKLWTTESTPWGWYPKLPDGVYVEDLLSPRAIQQLTTICQRRVTTWYHEKKGAWLIVDLDRIVGGIPERITYREIQAGHPTSGFRVPVGVADERTVKTIDLLRTPHLLIGGATGGGKSNLLHVLICTLLERFSPRRLQFVLIDLKMVEFTYYEQLPHLATPVITELEEASKALQHLATLVDKRMRQIAGKARSVAEWNKAHPDRPIPELFLIVDEMADLMLIDTDTGQATERYLARIGNKGRAAGVHMIVCTQRPAVAVVSNLIKANVSARFAFRMPTMADSRTIIDYGTAADLPNIPGRVVLLQGADLRELQTPLITETDIKEITNRARAEYQHQANESGQDLKTIATTDPLARENVLRMIRDELDGRVATTTLHAALKDYGVSRPQAARLVEDLLNKLPARIDGILYDARPERNYWKLTAIDAPQGRTPRDAAAIAQWREIREKRARLAQEEAETETPEKGSNNGRG